MNEDSRGKQARRAAGSRRERAKRPGSESVAPEMLEDLFRDSPIPFAAGRPDGKIIALNQACCDLLGYSAEELRRLDWSKDLTPPEWHEREAAMLGQLLQTKQPVRYEKEHFRRDGSRVAVEVLVNLCSAEDGDRPYFWLSIYDLSDRKRAEAEIESLARFPDENPYPVLRISKEGVILYANPASLPLLREGGNEVGGAAPGFLRELIDEAFRKQSHTRVDIERVGGTWSFVVAPIAEAGYANLYGRDVTERIQAREALRESEERYRNIVETTREGVWVVDAERRTTYVNQRMAEMLGYTVGEMMGRPHLDFMDEAGREVSDRNIERRRKGISDSYEFPLIRKDGSRLWTLINATPRFDESGQFAGSVSMLTDITDRRRTEEEMRLQSTALQAAANGIVITDRKGNIQWVNDAFTRLTGYKPVEAMGQNPRVLKSGRHDEAFYKELWQTVLSGRVWRGEIVNKRKDGRLYTEEMTITPVAGDGGEITNFIAIKHDITGRKMAEEALADANARVQRLLSANVVGIAEFDATTIVNANRALLDMTGYSERDVLRGRLDWREITPPEYVERDNRAWREMMEHGECLPYEKEYITRDGKRVPILIAGVRLTEDPVTGVFLNLDITDWKLMERELQETTHFAEHLFESTLIGLMRLTEKGLLNANDAFLEMVGYTRADLEAGLIDVRAMTPPEFAEQDERATGEMLATEEAAAYEKEYVRKDGSRVPVLIGRKLIRESPLEWVAFVMDLTERKRMEADLERMRTEFLGEISHELKTPLTAIKGCASMALSSATPPDQAEARELFEVVDAQANRLTDLVGNLLDMTRIEGGRLSMEPEEIELAKIVEEARVIFEHSRYPHELRVELPSGLPRVRADGRRIVQVLTNLYTNAAKFSPPDLPIIVSAEREGKEVVVCVRDQGMGIPGDKMPLLFQKFVQLHTVGAKGTGLGLFICKGIVEAQGGRIWAESDGEGQGATFSFALPAVPRTRTAKGAGRAAAASGMASPGRRVLAIDDEPSILRYVGHCMKTAGYEVISTTDASAAAKLVGSHKPDIVLLDMRLPGTSGLEVLEEIRKLSSVPVAFITATANREDVERGRSFGGTTWLEKPFSREQLLAHVRAVLAPKGRRKR